MTHATAMLAESSMLSSLLLMAGVMLMMLFMLSRLYKRRRGGAAKPRLSPHEQLERIRQAGGMRSDLEQLSVEIEQMARRVGAQLDAKIVHLDQLLREADARIATLRKLSGQPTGTATDNAPTPAPGARPTQAESQPQASEEALREQKATRPAVPGFEEPSEEADQPDDPLSRQVYVMADAGADAMQIARQLKEHVGKIELILALRR